MDDIPDFEPPQWKRLPTVQFPKVWHRFQSRPKNGTPYNMRIEDLPEDRFEEVAEFMQMYYLTGEPLSVSSKILEDQVSLMVYQHIMMNVILPHRMSVIAVLDEDTPKPRIVGVHLLTIATKGDPALPHVPAAEAVTKMIKMYYDIRKDVDPYEVLETNTFLHDWGICVHPEFRGLNVGFNILTSLQYICKAFDIAGSMMMFTRTESQILAERVGFKMYTEIVYREYKNENGDIVFPVEGTRSVKFMAIKYI